MTPKAVESLQKLRTFLDQPDLEGKIIFATRSKGESPKLTYATFTRDTIKDYLKEFGLRIDKYSEREPVKYGLSDFDSDTYQFIPSSDIPGADTLLEDAQTPIKRLLPDFIKSIRFTELRFYDGEGEIIAFFKIYSKTRFLTANNKFKFILQDSVLTPLTKDVIAAPPTFDCILFRGIIYIFNRSNFEKMFDYKQIFEQRAEVVFDYFEQPRGYTIQGLDELKAKCMATRTKLRRLAIVSEGIPYKSITFEQVVSLTKKKRLDDPSFDIKKRTLKFRTPRAFFRLFDEQFVIGELTNTEYISTRKIRFKAPTR